MNLICRVVAKARRRDVTVSIAPNEIAVLPHASVVAFHVFSTDVLSHLFICCADGNGRACCALPFIDTDAIICDLAAAVILEGAAFVGALLILGPVFAGQVWSAVTANTSISCLDSVDEICFTDFNTVH